MLEVSRRQQRLAKVLKATEGTVRSKDVADALSLDRAHAARLLAAWHKQGVMRRVGQGVYVPVTPATVGQSQVLEDPWVIVPEIYEPAYVGGWSALEHWGLTEQVFRSVCVLTSKRTKVGNRDHQGVTFYVKRVPRKTIFGTKTVWRGTTRILVSDPHKTVLDILMDPYLGAGLQHSADCIREYRKTYSQPADRQTLLKYARQFNNGALFKKLGFIAESLAFEPDFIKACADSMTKGYAELDKAASDTRLVTRWRLRVPRGMSF
jgi:predicted transcriptional regulator of viral defense system